jgi:hypothetical protein
MENEYLHNWVFVFNPFKQLWNAMPREHYNDYWNNSKHPSIIKSSSIKTLLEVLHKTQGDKTKLDKLGKS